jgi:hypothetical protein
MRFNNNNKVQINHVTYVVPGRRPRHLRHLLGDLLCYVVRCVCRMNMCVCMYAGGERGKDCVCVCVSAFRFQTRGVDVCSVCMRDVHRLCDVRIKSNRIESNRNRQPTDRPAKRTNHSQPFRVQTPHHTIQYQDTHQIPAGRGHRPLSPHTAGRLPTHASSCCRQLAFWHCLAAEVGQDGAA